MKLILSRGHMFGPVYVDEKEELGLGPGEFALIGPKHIVVYMDGRLHTTEIDRKKKPSRGRK